jgi:hypothetical protein
VSLWWPWPRDLDLYDLWYRRMWGLVASMMVRVGACVTSSGPVWVWDRVFEGQSTFQIVAHKVREGKKKKREIK